MDEDRQPVKSRLLRWFKANLIFAFVVSLLLVAAILSLTYAYNRGGQSLTGTDLVPEVDVKTPSPMTPAEQLADNEKNSHSGGTGHSPGQPSASAGGSTLGSIVNCAVSEKNEADKLRQSLDQLAEPLTLQDVEYYNQTAQRLYGNYVQAMKRLGCPPATALDSLLKEPGNNQRESLP